MRSCQPFLLALAALTAACGGRDKDDVEPAEADADIDADTDGDTDTDTDSDTDSDADADTGLTVLEVMDLPHMRIVGNADVDIVGDVVEPGGDFSGDGVPDLLNVPSDSKIMYGTTVYQEGEHSIEAAEVILDGQGNWLPDEQADINNDGYGDVLFLATTASTCTFLGPLSGAYSRDSDAVCTPYTEVFGSIEVALGDFNGDALTDVLLGSPAETTNGCNEGFLTCAGAAGLLLGPLTVQAELPEAELHAAWYGDSEYAELGAVVDNVGDNNGDGIDDMLVQSYAGASSFGEERYGAAYLIHGPGTPGRHIVDPSMPGFYSDDELSVTFVQAGLGDLDNDGYDDLGFGLYGTKVDGYGRGLVLLAMGPAEEPVPLSTLTARVVGPRADLGADLTALGDVNEDGWRDLLVGGGCRPEDTYNLIGATVAFGPFSGLRDLTEMGTVVVNSEQFGLFGWGTASPGDMGGDGVPELVVSSPTWGLDTDGHRYGATFIIDGSSIPTPWD